MKRTTRNFTTLALGCSTLTLGSLGAQATDSTRATTRSAVRDSTAAGRETGMRRRIAGSDDMGPRNRDDYSPRRRGFSSDHPDHFSADGLGGGEHMTRSVEFRGPRGHNPLLRGITLSVDQEKALRATHSKQLLQAKPLMIELLAARTDEQIARLDGDQKALDAASARLATSRTRLDSLRSKRASTADVRSILTPDQGKILDRNLSELSDRSAGANDGSRAGRGGERGRGYRRGPHPQRPGHDR